MNRKDTRREKLTERTWGKRGVKQIERRNEKKKKCENKKKRTKNKFGKKATKIWE